MPTEPVAKSKSRLREVVLVLLKIGVTAFGGPAAHIAMMEDECVNRRGWLTRERFLDFLGAVNLLPGPNSTEMAIYLGYVRGGWAGLVLGGVCFILPSAIFVTALAWIYVRFGALPQMDAVLHAVKPVIIAIIARALWRYSVTALKTGLLVGIAVAATLAGYFIPHPLWLLAAAALVSTAFEGARKPRQARAALLLLLPAAGASSPAGLASLFLYFLKVGTVLFGSGYVLFAFLRADLVERWHWVTNSQLVDAVAVGQITPGPISTAATFLGYILAGPMGALVATVAMFLPAFVYVAISEPLVRALRRSRLASAALDGVIAGSVALIAVVTIQLGRTSVVDAPTLLIFLASFAVLTWTRLNSAWLILAAGAIGLTLK
ncbi:MAG TPA: chromate efflux transporter [Terriglobales bacterium]|nr:chromate efflux transporter [Terriglobales bacterium]